MILRKIAILKGFNFKNYSLVENFSIRRCKVKNSDLLRGVRLPHVSPCIYPRVKPAGYFSTPDRVVRWIPCEGRTRKWYGVRRITADPGFGMTCDPCGNSPPTLHLPRRYRTVLLVYLTFERGVWTPSETCMNSDPRSHVLTPEHLGILPM